MQKQMIRRGVPASIATDGWWLDGPPPLRRPMPPAAQSGFSRRGRWSILRAMGLVK